MKKIISLFIVCVCLSSFVMADDCSDALSEAKSLYNSGNYQKAKSLFEYVKSECGSSYGDASAWIRKCNDALTPNLTVSKSSLSFGSSGGSQSITVSSNRSWSLQGTSSSIFTVQRSGNTVTVQCNKNTTSSYRNDYFTIVTDGGDKTVKIVVSQEAPVVSLSVSKTSISCSASGTTEYLTVTSSKSWEVQYASGTMYDVTRSGNTLTVKIKPNSGSESRSDYFNVRTTDGEKVVKITLSQEPAQELSVSQTSINCSASGTTEYLTVTSSKTWEVQYASGTMYDVTRNGNTLTVKIKPNSTKESRSDYFNVRTKDGSKVIKVQMTQSGTKDLSVSKTSINASYNGTTEYITVTSGKAWEVQYASGTMYDVTRSGNTLTVKIKPNSSTESRSDYFNVRTTDGSKVVKIKLTQDGKPSSSSASTPKAKVHKVWAEHNVMHDGVKCMAIHVKFEVDNMKGKTGRIAAYYYTESGTKLVDKNNSYRTTAGNVSVGEDFTPSYDGSIWEDFVFYMPNSELHITEVGDYKFFVAVWDHNSNQLADSDWVSFSYGK